MINAVSDKRTYLISNLLYLRLTCTGIVFHKTGVYIPDIRISTERASSYKRNKRDRKNVYQDSNLLRYFQTSY